MAATLRNVRYARSALAATAREARCIGTRSSSNMAFGGTYRIAGTVTELGAPGAYRVRLYDRKTGALLRETWSAADGSYSFGFIAHFWQGYFVIAHDNPGDPLNAAIADLVTPEPMP